MRVFGTDHKRTRHDCIVVAGAQAQDSLHRRCQGSQGWSTLAAG